MIKPTPGDVGRRVVLPRLGAAPISGALMGMIDQVFASVLYEGDRFPIATDIEKLNWDAEQKSLEI